MNFEKHIWKILSGFQPSLVLMTANQLGIFDQISNSPASAQQVAKALKLSQRGTERLLNALSGLDIISKDKDQFHLSKSSRSYLSESGDHSLKNIISVYSQQLSIWKKMPEFVKSGKPIQDFMQVLDKDSRMARGFIDGMHKKGMQATWLIARKIPVGEARRLLDVGGGPGTYTLEWAKIHNNLHGTIFDIPSVVNITKEYIKRYHLEDRIKTKAGDFIKDDLGDGYDLILLANILHLYDAETGRNLVKKAFKALQPGGRILVHGFCTDEDQTGPIEDVLFGLGMALFYEGGASHSIREKISWLEDAGLTDIRHFRIEATPSRVLTGTKPY